MRTERLDERIDRRAACELGALALFVAAVALLKWLGRFGFVPSAWVAGGALGAALGGIAALILVLGWRRTGGPRLRRLGRDTWRTGAVPDDAATRTAVLRDLERRDRALERNRLGPWALPVVWTVLAVLNVSEAPSPASLLSWLLVLGALLAAGIREHRDRRERPRLRALIARLRSDPRVEQLAPLRSAAA